MKMLTGLYVIAWFAVLTIGLTVNSSELQDGAWIALPLFVASSTITNVGILSILASLIGNGGDWIESVRRGFCIYVMLISGVIVLFTDSVADPTPSQYGKIAGSVSLVCLVCGYKPELFEDFLNRVGQIFKGSEAQQ